MSLRLAACQFSATPDPASNLGLIRGQAAEAAAQGATVVVCPEASMVPFGSDLAAAAEPLDGAFADGVRALAQQLGVLLVVGMFTPSGDGPGCATRC